MASTAAGTDPCAVMNTQTHCASISRNRLKTSKPEIPGRRTSRTTTSGGSCAKTSSASSPDPAHCTVSPCVVNTRLIALRRCSSSSTTRMRATRLSQGQTDCRCGAATGDALQHNLAAVLLNDVSADREAEAAAVLLGAVKGFEGARHEFGCHPGPLIADDNRHVNRFSERVLNLDGCAVGAGLTGVENHVDQHLPQFVQIAANRRRGHAANRDDLISTMGISATEACRVGDPL